MILLQDTSDDNNIVSDDTETVTDDDGNSDVESCPTSDNILLRKLPDYWQPMDSNLVCWNYILSTSYLSY